MQSEFYTSKDFTFRKVTSIADARMRTRTAKEQHAEALDAIKVTENLHMQDPGGDDADDESVRGYL